MGKDKFGAKRGMCALCECKEYTKPSNDSQNCDYCDHKPVSHIEVIPLGTCSCNACSVYTSSKEFEYDECEFCGCPPQNHQGWNQIQMEIEKIKNRFAKPTGAIKSIVAKHISASPQPNPSTIPQGMPPIAAPLPIVNYVGGLQDYSNPTQPQGPQVGGTVPHGARYDVQAQHPAQQSPRTIFSQKPKLQIHPSGPKSAFEKYYELEKFQREVTNAKSQVRAKFEYFRNCLNSIENEKICELDGISEKYEELFSYHQANLFEMEIVKSRISKFKQADLQPALKKITSTLDNNKKMIEESNIKIPDNLVTWNESSFEKTLQKLCNIDVGGLKGLDFKQLPIDNVPLYTYTTHSSCTNKHGFTNVTGYQGPLDDKNPNPSEHRSQKKN